MQPPILKIVQMPPGIVQYPDPHPPPGGAIFGGGRLHVHCLFKKKFGGIFFNSRKVNPSNLVGYYVRYSIYSIIMVIQFTYQFTY